jgi:hypothetical protein
MDADEKKAMIIQDNVLNLQVRTLLLHVCPGLAL